MKIICALILLSSCAHHNHSVASGGVASLGDQGEVYDLDTPVGINRSPASSACFDDRSSANLTASGTNFVGFQFVQNSFPPWWRNGIAPQFNRAYPATSFGTANDKALTQSSPSSQLGQQFWLWGNRCLNLKGVTPLPSTAVASNPKNWPYACTNATVTKGNANYQNPIPIVDNSGRLVLSSAGVMQLLRPIYSTYITANVCTLAQAKVLSGEYTGTSLSALQMWVNRELERYPDYKMNLKVGAHNLPVAPSPMPNPLPPSYLKGISQLQNLKSTVVVNGSPRTYLVDVCIVAQPKTDLTLTTSGFLLDYEVQDTRPTAAVLSLFKDLKELLPRDQKLYVMTNDINNASVRNGITAANISLLLASIDYLMPVVWTGATSGGAETSELSASPYKYSLGQNFTAQVNKIDPTGKLSKAERAKFIPFVSLYYDACPSGARCTATGVGGYLADYEKLRKSVLGFGASGFSIWRNGETQLGDQACSARTPSGMLVNQITACLAFGKCKGDFSGGL